MSKGLLAYLKEKIQESVEKVPSIVNTKVIYVGKESLNGIVIYGNKDVITHYMEGEVLKNIRMNNSTGTIPVDIAIGDIVQVSFINGDSNAPYLIGKATKGTTNTGAGPSSQEKANIPSGVAFTDSALLNTSLKEISNNYDSFASIVNTLHTSINTIDASQTWDANYKIIIAANKGGPDNLGQVEGLPLPESYINLIIALKLKELLIKGGAHKNSIMLTREWETKPNNVETIEQGIKSFYPTFCISIQSWTANFTNVDLIYGDEGTKGIQNKIIANFKKTYPDQEFKSENNGLTDFSNDYSIRERYPPDMILFNYSNSLFGGATGNTTLNNLYSIAFDIVNAILKQNGMKELSLLNATYSGDLVTTIKRVIYGNETAGKNFTESQVPGYGIINPKAGDFGAGQWLWYSRQQDLLKLIRSYSQADYNTLKSEAPSVATYMDDMSVRKSKMFSGTDKEALIKYLSCDAGKKAQEATIVKDINTYILNAKERKVTETKAIIYYCDIEHNKGCTTITEFWKSKMTGVTPTLDNLHAAARSFPLETVSRRDVTYNYLKGLSI